ncbi:MAG: DUF2147 domain-containing protein [Sphingobium sp.]|nr:DUF2147 domain-containing protein [Sphingobium sp.]
MVALSMMVPVVAQAAKPNVQSFGTWRNPQNSVHVRAQPCGKQMCGVVVWANDKAKADAAKGGTNRLVGSALFQGFVRESEGVWRGKVFVPDIGKTFSGTISVLDADHMEGKGCLLGKVGCKSQIWTRMK